METQVLTQQENGVAHLQTPTELLALAIDKNLDIDKLEKLMAMKERWDTQQAKKMFFSALGEFQAKVPEIRKNKEVSFGETKYYYAPLGDIVRQIKDTCNQCGLAYRWEIKDDKEEIQVSCIVTHIEGHSETTTMTANPDDSGKKNKIQSRGSAIEYMKRYTLIGALGLSTADSDIDARGDYGYDVDKLHRDFMDLYGKVIQLDSSKSVWHPDNWLIERTGKNYVKAIGDIRKVLAQLTKKAQ